MTWDLFWGNPGKTGGQTAASQRASSSPRGPSSERPRLPAPTAAGSWTASLCGPQSSTPAGNADVRKWGRGSGKPRHLIAFDTCARRRDTSGICLLTLLVLNLAGQVTILLPHYVIPDMEWIHCWNNSICNIQYVKTQRGNSPGRFPVVCSLAGRTGSGPLG